MTAFSIVAGAQTPSWRTAFLRNEASFRNRVRVALLQLVEQGELVDALRLDAERIEHAAVELVGARRRDDDHMVRIARRLLVLLGDAPGDGRVRVRDIVMLAVDLRDARFRILVRGPVRPESLLDLREQLAADIVAACCCSCCIQSATFALSSVMW